MKPIVLELTPQEAQWLLGFINEALKSQGVAVLDQAFVLKNKLAAAANAAAEVEKPLPDAKTS